MHKTEAEPIALRAAIRERSIAGSSAVLLIAGLLFLGAFALRLYHVDEPPHNFRTRHYHSALIARGYYYKTADAPGWQKRIAELNAVEEGALEPPVMEILSSTAYRLAGGERIWIPRVISTIFWLVGGLFLFAIARRLTSEIGALIAVAFYLFLPFSVYASRSFQPDPLMVALTLASLWAILRSFEIASLLSSAAILVKPAAAFFILGAFISQALAGKGIKGLFKLRSAAFLAISLLPAVLYYGYGALYISTIREQAASSFVPKLFLETVFWDGWFNLIKTVVEDIAFLGGLVGILAFPRGKARAFAVGLWLSYLVYALTFNYAIYTHNYYQLPLIPIVALSLGAIAAFIVERAPESGAGRRGLAVVAIALAFAVMGAREARWQMYSPSVIDEVRLARKVGARVNHSSKVIFLSSVYALPLKYHGWMAGTFWPNEADLIKESLSGRSKTTIEERFIEVADRIEGAPEYFVVTDFPALWHQPELEKFLKRNYRIAAKEPDFLIFDLREKIR